MGPRPRTHLLQGVDHRGRSGPEIDIRNVEDLHARPLEPAAVIRVGAGVFAQSLEDLPGTWLGFSATAGSRLFISIRMAASWIHPLQVRFVPRGDRTVRGAARWSGMAPQWSLYAITAISMFAPLGRADTSTATRAG